MSTRTRRGRPYRHPSRPESGGGGRLWRRWVVITTAGEVLGFSVPALAGALTTVAHIAGPSQAGILVAAGAVEGALLGWAQAIVLRHVVTGLGTGSWVRATALGAMLAYAMGMLPSLLFPQPVLLMITVAAVAGTVLLCSIGTAQWLVLRRHRPHAAWWIPVTAGAWLLGLGVFLAVATPSWQPGQSVVLIAATGVLAGLVMAATVAAATGWAVLRLRTEVRSTRHRASGEHHATAFGDGPEGPAGSGTKVPRVAAVVLCRETCRLRDSL